MTTDAHQIRDALVADFTAAEAANGLMPDGEKAARIAADLLSDAERPQRKDPVSKPPVVKPTVAEQLEKRGAKYLDESAIAKLNRPVRAVPRTKQERVEAALAQRRLTILRQHPEWREAMWAAANRGYQAWLIAMRRGDPFSDDAQPFIARELMKVLDASNLTFGDWTRLPKGRPVSTHGKGL